MTKKYDVVIIGSGIGGLTCGCYLAKTGKRILIVEQHFKVGGYCTSFNRKGYTFEAGAIEFSEQGDSFTEILKELNIFDKIKFNRHSPRVLIFTKNGILQLGKSAKHIVNDLKASFPDESTGIDEFFAMIINYNLAFLYRKLKDISFDSLLDSLFKNKKLKETLRIFASQMATSPSKASALSTITHFKNFVIEKGVYPSGGLQKMADAFGERFKELGGELLLSSLAEGIIVKNNKACGITLQSGEKIFAHFVVSNGDAQKTFHQLVGKGNLEKTFGKKLNSLVPSASLFIVYLGIKKNLRKQFNCCTEIWDIPSHRFEEPRDARRIEKNFKNVPIFCYTPSFQDRSIVPQNSESLSTGFFTPCMTRSYWEKRKAAFADKVIRRIKKIVPFENADITVKEIAVPQTLEKYTLNSQGAFKGWAPIVGQVDGSIMPSRTPIRNLYLVGHWVTTPAGEAGIPQAAFVGKRVAKTIASKSPSA